MLQTVGIELVFGAIDLQFSGRYGGKLLYYTSVFVFPNPVTLIRYIKFEDTSNIVKIPYNWYQAHNLIEHEESVLLKVKKLCSEEIEEKKYNISEYYKLVDNFNVPRYWNKVKKQWKQNTFLKK